jgi:hypothetical protein
MHKCATNCNKTLGKWYKNKHGASKIMDTLEMYQTPEHHDELETRDENHINFQDDDATAEKS